MHAPGPFEGRLLHNEPYQLVPDVGHRVRLDHVDQVSQVGPRPFDVDKVHQALKCRQPNVDELAVGRVVFKEAGVARQVTRFLETPDSPQARPGHSQLVARQELFQVQIPGSTILNHHCTTQ